MPPDPVVTATIDQDVYEAICTELGIIPPKLVVHPHGGGGRLHGEWRPGRIDLYCDVSMFPIAKLRFVQGEIVETLLHELRHAYQSLYWSSAKQNDQHMEYSLRPTEIDAEQYASANKHRFRFLARVSRKQQNSGFSRLSKHARPTGGV